MKPTTTQIKTILEDESILNSIENLQSTHPTYQANETTIQEAIENFLDIRSVILESIEKGIFEEVPFNRRNSILNNLNSIKQYHNNVSQFLSHYNSLNDQFHLINISRRVNEDLDVNLEFKELNRLRRKYKKVLEEIGESEDIQEKLKEIFVHSNDSVEDLKIVKERGDDLDLTLKKIRKEIELKQESIEVSEQDIENRKKEILAFFENIQKNENKLQKIEEDLSTKINESIASKTKRAKELISEAEQALELKQTEGISKAYSSRLEKLTNEKTKTHWLIAAIVFVFITLMTGFLLTGGTISISSFNLGFSATENIAFVIGRIIVTGIGISGAVFCANRYVHLKNLEEDYEYKVVLSKSILAFSNKIRELDKDKLAEYLTQVLNDLHQDPLRERKSYREDRSKSINLNQIPELLQKWKEMN